MYKEESIKYILFLEKSIKYILFLESESFSQNQNGNLLTLEH